MGSRAYLQNLCNILVVPTIKTVAEILSAIFICDKMISLFMYVFGGAMKVIIHIFKTTKEVQKIPAKKTIASNERKGMVC